MAKPIDEARWELLRVSYLAQPGNHTAAAAAATVNWRTARYAWEHGAGGRPALRVVTEMSQRTRRALVADVVESQAAEAERIKAELLAIRDDIVSERERAAVAIRDMEAAGTRLEAATKRQQEALVGRGNADAEATGLQELAWMRNVRAYNLAVLSVLHGALGPRAVKSMHDALERVATDGGVSDKEKVALMRSLVSFAKPLTESLKIGLEGERLLAGDPTHIVRHEHTTVAMTDEEYRKTLEQLTRRQASLDEVDAEIEPAKALPEVGGCQGGDTPLQNDDGKGGQVRADTSDCAGAAGGGENRDEEGDGGGG